jgi:hypothetical protein
MQRFEYAVKDPKSTKTSLHELAKKYGRRFVDLIISCVSFMVNRSTTILRHLNIDFGKMITVDSMHLIQYGVIKAQIIWSLRSLSKDEYQLFYDRVQSASVCLPFNSVVNFESRLHRCKAKPRGLRVTTLTRPT